MNSVDDCVEVLAKTGDGGFPPFALILLLAVAGIGALIVASRSKRKRALLAGGAFALALTLGVTVLPLSAPGAYAATGENCATKPTPAPTPTKPPAPNPDPTDPPADEEVTTAAPTAVPGCGAEPTVSIPESKGIEYTQTRDGDTVTVTAAVLPGYVMAPGTVTSWTFDMSFEPAVQPRTDLVWNSNGHWSIDDSIYTPTYSDGTDARADLVAQGVTLRYFFEDGWGADLPMLAVMVPTGPTTSEFRYLTNDEVVALGLEDFPRLRFYKSREQTDPILNGTGYTFTTIVDEESFNADEREAMLNVARSVPGYESLRDTSTSYDQDLYVHTDLITVDGLVDSCGAPIGPRSYPVITQPG